MARSGAPLRARSINRLIRNITASTRPQARLQARAPTRISRVSSRPPSATLIELVNVRTMMSPKRISDVRSTGSRRRCVKGVALLLRQRQKRHNIGGGGTFSDDGPLPVDPNLRGG